MSNNDVPNTFDSTAPKCPSCGLTYYSTRQDSVESIECTANESRGSVISEMKIRRVEGYAWVSSDAPHGKKSPVKLQLQLQSEDTVSVNLSSTKIEMHPENKLNSVYDGGNVVDKNGNNTLESKKSNLRLLSCKERKNPANEQLCLKDNNENNTKVVSLLSNRSLIHKNDEEKQLAMIDASRISLSCINHSLTQKYLYDKKSISDNNFSFQHVKEQKRQILLEPSGTGTDFQKKNPSASTLKLESCNLIQNTQHTSQEPSTSKFRVSEPISAETGHVKPHLKVCRSLQINYIHHVEKQCKRNHQINQGTQSNEAFIESKQQQAAAFVQCDATINKESSCVTKKIAETCPEYISIAASGTQTPASLKLDVACNVVESQRSKKASKRSSKNQYTQYKVPSSIRKITKCAFVDVPQKPFYHIPDVNNRENNYNTPTPRLKMWRGSCSSRFAENYEKYTRGTCTSTRTSSPLVTNRHGAADKQMLHRNTSFPNQFRTYQPFVLLIFIIICTLYNMVTTET